MHALYGLHGEKALEHLSRIISAKVDDRVRAFALKYSSEFPGAHLTKESFLRDLLRLASLKDEKLSRLGTEGLKQVVAHGHMAAIRKAAKPEERELIARLESKGE